jgi:GNAT superfamily N-acetyltransferase
MDMEIRIRQAEAADSEEITCLLVELGWFPRFTADQADDRSGEVERGIRECLMDESHSLYVAEDTEGRFIGYASVHWLPYMFLAGREGYLSELFVTKNSRGLGVGKALLETVTDEARRRGCTRLSLITSRHRESYQRQFYVKQGWTERDAVANFVLEL